MKLARRKVEEAPEQGGDHRGRRDRGRSRGPAEPGQPDPGGCGGSEQASSTVPRTVIAPTWTIPQHAVPQLHRVMEGGGVVAESREDRPAARGQQTAVDLAFLEKSDHTVNAGAATNSRNNRIHRARPGGVGDGLQPRGPPPRRAPSVEGGCTSPCRCCASRVTKEFEGGARRTCTRAFFTCRS